MTSIFSALRKAGVVSVCLGSILCSSSTVWSAQTTAQTTWDQLLGVLPLMGPSAASGQPVDIKMDGDTARYYIEALLASRPTTSGDQSKAMDALLHEVLPKLKHVRLMGTQKSLIIQATFNDAPVNTEFAKRDDIKRFALYGLVVPHYIRYRLSFQDPVIVLEDMEDTKYSIALKVKIPVISDLVYLRRIQVNPTDGSVQAEAGVVDNVITVYAKAKLYDKTFDGVDLWHTFLRNYCMFMFPIWDAEWSFFAG